MSGAAPASADLSALNYTVLAPYNGSTMTGGDSLAANLNVFYEVRIHPAMRHHEDLLKLPSFSLVTLPGSSRQLHWCCS